MPKSILIIEDEKNIQNILKAFLEDAGYNITLAGDGMAGIAAFHKTDYDLVLLDIMMPKMDGYTVCEMIRNESDTPVILLTALDDEDSQMKGFDLLADDYITKPFPCLCSCAGLKRYYGAHRVQKSITMFCPINKSSWIRKNIRYSYPVRK